MVHIRVRDVGRFDSVAGTGGGTRYQFLGDLCGFARDFSRECQSALRRRPGDDFVARDVDDQRVVELAQVLDGLDDAPDLMIGVGEVGAEDVGRADA